VGGFEGKNLENIHAASLHPCPHQAAIRLDKPPVDAV